MEQIDDTGKRQNLKQPNPRHHRSDAGSACSQSASIPGGVAPVGGSSGRGIPVESVGASSAQAVELGSSTLHSQGTHTRPKIDCNRTEGDGLTALDFASVARRLAQTVRLCDLVPPLFRSPPDLPGISRSLRHNADGTCTVSVVVRGRSRLAVMADMIDGVTVANNLDIVRTCIVRDALWSAMDDFVGGRTVSDLAKVGPPSEGSHGPASFAA